MSMSGGPGVHPQLPGSPGTHQWRRDMFRPGLVHLVDVQQRARRAQGRRWVFAVDNRIADLDAPEDGTTSCCPDCLSWLARQAKDGTS